MQKNHEGHLLKQHIHVFESLSLILRATEQDLYVDMSLHLCSLDFPLAESVFLAQPPQIPETPKLIEHTSKYAS